MRTRKESLDFLIGFGIGTLFALCLASFTPRCDAEVDSIVRLAVVVPPPASECRVSTLTASVLGAMANARKLMLRDEWEYGGAIYRNVLGQYCASVPATSRERVRLWLGYHETTDYPVVALYHTHPGTDPNTFVFSGIDADTACRKMVPSFIVTEDRMAFRFDPSPSFCAYLNREQPPIVVGRFVGMVQP